MINNDLVYHATRVRFLSSIKRQGIRWKRRKSFRNQTTDNFVYLSFDRNNAAMYAINADNIPKEWKNDDIVILAVHRNDLDYVYVYSDPNLDEDFANATTMAYGKVIPPNKIGIINFADKRIEPLVGSRIDSKFIYNRNNK